MSPRSDALGFNRRLDGRLQTLEARVDALKPRLEARLHAFEPRVHVLEPRVNALKPRVQFFVGHVSTPGTGRCTPRAFQKAASFARTHALDVTFFNGRHVPTLQSSLRR